MPFGFWYVSFSCFLLLASCFFFLLLTPFFFLLESYFNTFSSFHIIYSPIEQQLQGNVVASLVSAFRLKPSVLPDATCHFLATSPNSSPSQIQKKDDKPKPHRCNSIKGVISKNWNIEPCYLSFFSKVTKKETLPPFKRPTVSFVAFTLEKLKQQKVNSDSPIVYSDTMRECAAAGKKLSETEKQVSVLSYGIGSTY